MEYVEFKVPKKNGKMRNIVAPNEELKRYQRMALHKLEHYFNQISTQMEVNGSFHGFLRGKNCITAAEQHCNYNTTVMFDIQNFFDNVKVKMFDEYMFDQLDLDYVYLFHKQGYAAQGFPSSPMLANIAIIPVIRNMKQKLTDKYGKNTITIYADDIQISVDQESPSIENEIEEMLSTELSQYGFALNPNKTRIRYARYGYRRILGINVGKETYRATRKTMRRIRNLTYKKEREERILGLIEWSKCKPPFRL